jgi:hypothetical protein
MEGVFIWVLFSLFYWVTIIALCKFLIRSRQRNYRLELLLLQVRFDPKSDIRKSYVDRIDKELFYGRREKTEDIPDEIRSGKQPS